MVASAADGAMDPAQYVYVDWGASFAANHQAAFPELSSPPVSISPGAAGAYLPADRRRFGLFPHWHRAAVPGGRALAAGSACAGIFLFGLRRLCDATARRRHRARTPGAQDGRYRAYQAGTRSSDRCAAAAGCAAERGIGSGRVSLSAGAGAAPILPFYCIFIQIPAPDPCGDQPGFPDHAPRRTGGAGQPAAGLQRRDTLTSRPRQAA
jgi:hypothetical protein